jgi:hypothetical protein
MKLVDNAKDWYKWLSVHCMVIAAAIQGAWIYVPDDMKQTMPPHIVSALTMVLLGLGVVGRLLKQNDKNE